MPLKPTCPTGTFMCIDPGVTGTGWAVFTGASRPLPFSTGVVRGKTFGILRTDRVAGVVAALHHAMHLAEPHTVFVEEPGLFAGSGVSYAAAIRGDLFTLSFVVGGLMYAASLMRAKMELISPAEWKGQLSKHGVRMRIQRALKLNPSARFPWADHETDAVGMGLSIQRKL